MKEIYLPDAAFVAAVREEIARGESVTIAGTGGSMRPFILPETDKITLSPLPEKLRPGHICMYLRENGKVVIHRINRRKKDSFVMLGDGQMQPEFGIKKEQMVAVVTRRIRDGEVLRCDTAAARRKACLEMRTRRLRKAFWRRAVPVYRKLKGIFRKS